MHIMEGFLPAEWCAVWFIISIPIVLYGVYQIKKITETTPESKALIAVSGAFMFILSSLKLPSVLEVVHIRLVTDLAQYYLDLQLLQC